MERISLAHCSKVVQGLAGRYVWWMKRYGTERQIGGRTDESCSTPLRPRNDVGTDLGGGKQQCENTKLLLTDCKFVTIKGVYLVNGIFKIFLIQQ